MEIKKDRIFKYINSWKEKGYPDDIPDFVPDELMKLNLAPSYKAIAIAILSNDINLNSLGFSSPKSEYYSVLKKIEIDERNKKLTNSNITF